MVALQNLYEASPISLQHFMTSLAGFRNNYSRYGTVYREHREWLENFDKYSLEQKVSHQIEELNRFLEYAAAHSEYYSELLTTFAEQRIHSLTDMHRIPLLEKDILRTDIDRIMTVPLRGSIVTRTGGTTGKTVTVRFTREDFMKRMAMLDHFKARAGFEHRKMRRATFTPKNIIPAKQTKQIFWRYNRACKQMLYSVSHLRQKNLHSYVESLNAFKPHAIDGFFSGMLDVANYMERNSIQPAFRPVALFPTSETITDSGRRTLERVFGAKVYDQYAASEGAPFVTECAYGSLHIEHSSGIFEELDSVSHEIAVTSFTTHGTPLIRYRIGDSMVLSDATDCDCGIESLVVERIEGRKDDYLFRADGERVYSSLMNNLFKDLPNSVKKAQAIQATQDSITLLLEIDEKRYTSQDSDTIRRAFYQIFEETTELEIKPVTEIPREKSGKHRLIKNLIITA